MSEVAFSESENAGIDAMPQSALNVYSVGISTGGIAEIRMARMNSSRQIIATTIDRQGADFAKEQITKAELDNQIEVRLEDVAQPLPHKDDSFDYIYARLVLHYLPKQAIDRALVELHRVLRRGNKLFVVVRSSQTPDATDPDSVYDPVTGLTTRTQTNDDGTTYSYSRLFHTEDSIRDHIVGAGFTVESVRSYDEKLFKDFMRTAPADHTDNVIELIAVK